MRRSLKATALVFALTGGVALAGAVTVQQARAADVSVQFNTGDVAFGYNDGYWDRSHQWHEWQKPADRDAYKKMKGNAYHDWKHDRDPDNGWHDKK